MNQDESPLYPENFRKLMELLRELPGVGRRSAERMALQFRKWDRTKLSALGEILMNFEDSIGTCPVCGGMSGGRGALCGICSSEKRDRSVICVVEDFSQLRTIEAGGAFRGLYHVLGGKLAPLEGRTADMLAVPQLLKRIDEGGIKEIILALSPDVEGRATEVYLSGFLRERGIRTSRLAQGLPAGADISYADPATIAAAINGRLPVE